MHITVRYVIPGFTIMSWLLRKHHSLVRYAPLDSYIILSSSEEWQVTPDRRVRYSSRAKETLNYPLALGSNEVLMIWNDNRGIKVSSNHFRPPIDNQQTSSSWWLLQKDTKSIQLRLLFEIKWQLFMSSETSETFSVMPKLIPADRFHGASYKRRDA